MKARRALEISRTLCALFRRDVAGRIRQCLDPLLDVAQRSQTDLDRFVGNIRQHIGSDGIAQAVETVDELSAARGQKQPVGAAVLGIVAPLEQPMLDEPVQEPHQRDRLAARTPRRAPPGRAPPAAAAETARSIARGWCPSLWRDDQYSCARAVSSRQVERRADVSGPAT